MIAVFFLLAGVIPAAPVVEAATPGSWTARSPLPTGNDLNGVVYGNSKFVTVGNSGTILTSSDAVSWTSVTPANGILYSVSYGNGMFVAVGSSGLIVTSSDGVSWTTRTSNTQDYLTGIVYGNSTFVVVTSNGAILTSSDGVSWTKGTSGTTNLLEAVSYGSGTFVTVGLSGVLTSSDGVSWTSRTSGIGNLYGVAYGNNSFVAVGYTGQILTSSNGVSWTSRTSGTTNSLKSVVYGNSKFVAVGDAGKIVASSDGMSWTSRTSGITDAMRGVVYSGSTYVAVGDSGTILTSGDGVSWISRTAGTTKSLIGVAYGGSTYVAVGAIGTIVTSNDGANWTSRTSGTASALLGITYGNSKFVAGGSSGTILTSSDGVSWTSRTSGTTNELYGVVYGNSKFVAAGGNGTILTSSDGVSWISRTSGTTNYLTGITYGNNTFVAVGLDGTILTSSDGVSWTSRTSGTTSALRSAAYGSGTYVAAGDSGTVLTSSDGVNWTSRTLGNTGHLYSVSYVNGSFVATGSFGAILTSSDGVSWTLVNLGTTSSSIKGIAYGSGTYAVVGDNGAIYSANAAASLASTANNSVSTSPSSVTAGGSVTLTASGDRQSEPGAMNGDERYVPTSWSSTESGKSGTFTLSGGSYSSTYATTAQGSYTVTATFKKQTWNGSAWTDTATTHTKTTAVTVLSPAQIVSAAAATLTPTVGADDAVTLTVKDLNGNTDTTFSGAHNVTISGYAQASDNSYGSFNGTGLTAAPNTISVTFASGAATVNLKLNKAATQTIGLSVAGVVTPAANTLSLKPVAGSAVKMALTSGIMAPDSNGGTFAQQPVVTLQDVYGNTSTGDSSTVVTASQKDTGTWVLIGTKTVTASAGIATFTDLGATNTAEVTGAQLAFDANSLTQIASASLTLPAPAPAHTVSASAATSTPTVGADNAISLTVKDSLGNTDTTFSGERNVTISGYAQAPDNSYGSFNGTDLTATPNTTSVTFASGTATVNLKLNKAAAQTIGLSVAGVATPATNTLSLAPVAGSSVKMALTTGIMAPNSNGGAFAQQPVVTLQDVYGNMSTGDSSTDVTVSQKDTGTWVLIGTKTVTASAGIATFTDLGATNTAEVTGAQLAFDANSLTQIASASLTLPAPAPAHTVSASAATSTPTVGADNAISLTVKDSLGNTDTTFSGERNVTISGYAQAPDNSYGSFNGTDLTATSNTTIITFASGAATVNLKLNKAAAQTIRLSVAGLATPAANTLILVPVAGSAVKMALSSDITAPDSNGSAFAKQPVVVLRDVYGNTSMGDNTTVVTVSKKDAGEWTLTGTTTATASSGVATFTGLGATNAVEVTGAQLSFDASGLAQITSMAVTLPWPGAAAPKVESVTSGDGHVLLTWSEVYGSVTYAVYQRTASGTYGAAVATVSGSVYDVKGLTNGTTYYFVVKAMNPAGISAASNEVNATPQVPAPGAPVLQPAKAYDGKISLVWTPVIGSKGYKIFKSVSSGTYDSEPITVSGSVYNYDVTELTNGTTYYFVVKATNPGGDSAVSNEVSATPKTVPSVPTGVSATAEDGQATISFTVPASNGGSAITGYEVTASPGNMTATGAGSPIRVTGLSNDTTYTFTVKAVNSAGSSMASAASNAVTPREPSRSSDTPTPTPTTSTAPIPTPEPTKPTVDAFKSIVNVANLIKTIESKVAEAKKANDKVELTGTKGHWAEKTIDTFVKLHFIDGYGNGEFKPNGNITRAEFATLISRVFDISGGTGHSVALNDISNHWAKDTIEKLMSAGVIGGYGDGTFKPDQTISREEIVIILTRIVNLGSVNKDTSKGNFTDLASASSYAANQIKDAAEAGIISGKNDGVFDPKGKSTRAEALTIILNALNLNPQVRKLLDSLN
ncbi:S-layer homology domain-containing protein [Paenibacillus ferrarius]|uniref:S-layer homology domain-containing protein n=1 Tax=Paenibacillus ferrarius TaxID=1469647 RepID=UPI001FC9DA24|nr:S-layer homology domain-containing protein [Paenibacillus ferrarius]